MKTALLALLVLPLAAVASAQNDDVKERRGYATVGLYFPQSVGGVDQSVGAVLSVGANVVTKTRYRIGVELRASANRFSFGGFSDDEVFEASRNVDEDGGSGDGTLTVSSFFVNASTRPRDGRGLFYGVGLGLGRASASGNGSTTSDNRTRFVYALFAGADFTRTTFAQARYQGSGEEGYRGVSLEFGYRF